MASKTHRASFLQAFHTAQSETARKAMIDSEEWQASANELPEFIDDAPNALDGMSSLPSDMRTRNLPAGQIVGRGVVRKISEKQVGFILKLIKERDLSGLKVLPGQTINPKEIPTMGVKGGSALIEKLLNCPVKPVAPVATSDSSKITIKGSDKQIAYMRSLASERNLTESDITAMLPRCQYYAGNVISELLAMPKANNTPKAENTLSEGMYVSGERIFKVYENQEHTRILCKELIDGSFEYMGMAQYKLPKDARKMTLAEAKHYGKVTGTCCVCSRRLTDEGSIEAGIGPVCASKF